MDSEATNTYRKSSSDLDESFLNKRDLKSLHKNGSSEPIQPDMSMIFTPLVKNPSTRSCSSNDEPKSKKPQPSVF
jgi:hypothetical protein